MRSSDLARLAGVSVRTLRHYHQIGLLPEPERSANGYRDYAASDLVRVLRVRRLADLGVPLARIDPSADLEDELTRLDEQYAEQIEELQVRRDMISALREHGTRVDTPAYAQRYLDALGRRQDLSPRSVETERDASVLLELLLDRKTLAELGALDDSAIAELADVTAALLGLGDDASDELIDAVADGLAAVFDRLQHTSDTPRLSREAADSLDDHVSRQLTAVQLAVVRRSTGRR
ncbi:DNA-binding transcriptional regulator, MerR family [Plantibacter flavus]|uniref:DNA-binding transcriptional MerR regulator n=1 Tax=Plantibacter flavus TaxID=150123 RepID=A0A3N2BXU6_9MICO|nr:MerR family transcriptional regulator [Plantibacter flavus]ROR80080.1 DNA-binding transcriptional MerR regulator [Plantibacter flavus]SMG29246.1 DNA-binding transcriptional regulator, MerR family [Plantibacter flavus]